MAARVPTPTEHRVVPRPTSVPTFETTTDEADYWWGHLVVAIGRGDARGVLFGLISHVKTVAYQRGLRDAKRHGRAKT